MYWLNRGIGNTMSRRLNDVLVINFGIDKNFVNVGGDIETPCLLPGSGHI